MTKGTGARAAGALCYDQEVSFIEVIALSLPRLDLQHWREGGEARRRFTDELGDALSRVGFFALAGHGIDDALLARAYAKAKEFFAQADDDKRRFFAPEAKGQRGFTPFRTEQALGEASPDLKEFYQVGRVDVADDHPVHAPYGPNRWPDDEDFRQTFSELYRALDGVAHDVLRACAVFLDEDQEFFEPVVKGGDTILRLIHYPPAPDAKAGEVRAGAHEDINLITLLTGATAEGLELLQRDGTYKAVVAGHDELLVDTGDMMQHLTNGLLRAVTHRVVLPAGGAKDARFSMPFFVHPHHAADLTPRPKSIARTGGVAKFDPATAKELLDARLSAIGVG